MLPGCSATAFSAFGPEDRNRCDLFTGWQLGLTKRNVQVCALAAYTGAEDCVCVVAGNAENRWRSTRRHNRIGQCRTIIRSSYDRYLVASAAEVVDVI